MLQGPDDIADKRAEVLRSVRTLLGFFTLALLVVEGILLKLALGLNGTDQIFLITGGVFVLIVVLVTVLAVARPAVLGLGEGQAAGQDARGSFKYDVFVSSPMFAFGDERRYKEHRQNVIQLTKTLHDECGYVCYYAGESRPSFDDFESSDIALSNDLQALRESRFYLLLIPETSPTSALVEAGAALILRKPSTYFVHEHAKLPFALENATNSGDSQLPRVKIYRYSSIKDLTRKVAINKQGLFA
jgi:hypothetical protein